MSSYNLNDLLAELRHILHEEPSPESWEALKARLARAYQIEGLLNEVTLEYVRAQIGRQWPEHYGHLFEMWIHAMDDDVQRHRQKRSEEARGRRVAYRVNRLLIPNSNNHNP